MLIGAACATRVSAADDVSAVKRAVENVYSTFQRKLRC